MRRFILSLLALAITSLPACGGSDAPDAASDGRPALAAASDAVFSEDLEDRACDVFTPAMVTEVAGMPADSFERSPSEEALQSRFMKGGTSNCTYKWGDGNSATVAQIDISEDAEGAARQFAMLTSTTTRGDYQRGMAAIGDQLERQQEAGEISGERAEGTRALAEGLGGAVAQGDPDEVLSQYEPVANIGDEAAIQEGEETVMGYTSYNSALWVRRGNVVFLVSSTVQNPPTGDTDRARTGAVTRALGRVVAARLD